MTSIEICELCRTPYTSGSACLACHKHLQEKCLNMNVKIDTLQAKLKTAEEALEYYAKNNHLINRTNNAGAWLAKRYGYKIAKNALKQIKEQE